MGVIFSDQRLRAMYPGGRGGPAARRLAGLWAGVFSLGLLPPRWVTLEVAGRRSGRVTRFPLGMAMLDGQRYLVSMLGEDCNWVRNVRAAGGSAVLRRRRGQNCRLVEVPAAERAPIIRNYLEHVPGARPHVPVGRHAPLAEFQAIAPRYPVFRVAPAAPAAHPAAPGPTPPAAQTDAPRGAAAAGRSGQRGPRSRRRHWWRWVLGGISVLVALVFLAVGLIVNLQPGPAPLALPAGAASAASGPLAGTWIIAAGSQAGFRVRESALGFSNYTVGRTSAVTGTAVISGDTVTSAVFLVNLTKMLVGGKHQPQFADSLGTARYPAATLTLTRPLALGPAFASGATVTAKAAADFAMHGVSRQVTVTLAVRRDGPALQAAGSIPVTFSEWGIKGPAGFGFFGSLAARGVAEFLLIMHRG
jgi:deazaflavin-dependent oxidoreductase (nitroreductase family)